MTSRGLSLTTKIFLGTASVVAAVLGATLAVTAQQASRTADAAVTKALGDARAQINSQLDERRSRHEALVKVLSENDIKDWGGRFVDALTQPAGPARLPRRIAG